jgi:hypothetical protein
METKRYKAQPGILDKLTSTISLSFTIGGSKVRFYPAIITSEDVDRIKVPIFFSDTPTIEAYMSNEEDVPLGKFISALPVPVAEVNFSKEDSHWYVTIDKPSQSLLPVIFTGSQGEDCYKSIESVLVSSWKLEEVQNEEEK